MNDKIVRSSKFMSLVLRHRPDKIGLILDANGWAKVSDLVACSKNGSVHLTTELIHDVVALNDKQRFVLSPDGKLIRAAQGHSISIDLDLIAQEPPQILYHGTASRFISSIREQGLIKGNRHHVHLSLDSDTALNVGIRHGKPVILTILTQEMSHDGIQFFCSDNGVWLTDWVEPKYIQFPEN